MALQLQITPPAGGSLTDITGYMTQEQWTIQEQYGRQGSTAMFYLEAPFLVNAPHQTALTLLVKPFAIVTLTDTTLNKVLFSGIVTDPYIDLTSQPTLCRYTLQCRDYTYYADGRLVSGTYTNQSAGSIIAQLTTTATPTVGLMPDPDMPAGPIISNIQFDHMQLSDAWDQVSQLASWQSDYAWWVGYDQVVRWGNEGDCNITGLVITDTISVPATTTLGYIETKQMFRYEWDGTTLRNSVVVRGASKSGTKTDTWGGDGNTTQWVLSFDLDTSGTVTLTVGGVSHSTEVVSKPSLTTKDFALVQQTTGAWLLAVGAGTVPAAGAAIVLNYTYDYPIMATAQLATSIAQYSGPNAGVYEMYLSDSTLTNAQMAYSRAGAELQQFALCEEKLSCTISADWPGHIRTGWACYVNLSSVPDSRNNWNVGIQDYFVVIQCQIKGIVGALREYDLVMVRFSVGQE